MLIFSLSRIVSAGTLLRPERNSRSATLHVPQAPVGRGTQERNAARKKRKYEKAVAKAAEKKRTKLERG